MDKFSKGGFVIKLSCETVQKLSEEEHKSKTATTGNETKNKDLNVDSKSNQNKDKVDEKKDKEEKPGLNVETVSDQNSKALDTQPTPSKPTPDDVYAAHVSYEGDVAIYTDPSTQQKYSWNKESSTWESLPIKEVPGRVYSYENDTHIYTEADGSKFFWDDEKKAWIPKVDDDFLAIYQMSYGFVDNTSKDEKKDEKKELEKKEAGVKRKNDPQWFQPSEDKNTKVYVSNLPLDLTEEEFVDFMQKCGLVERDPRTQKMKVKLYMDKEQNCFKGDALCTYIKIESVELALNLLDGSVFKGNKIKVERAHFELKGEYNPALKPKKKKKKELEKIKKMQQKLFDWRPEKFVGERSKHERIVIVKNLFKPSDFDKEVQLILDYQQDLREECSKCGEVRKVVIYDRHPEGVAQITMKEPEQADAVIQLINGRWFGKRQITAETWDGRTKYRIAETDADINKRIDKWGRFLEEGEEPEDKSKKDPILEDKKDIQEKNQETNVVPSSE
ncbi:HIV Tat-specific factor 1 homolog [Aricia agestis]|uniref:HIV Tat-specific factor 1 homolog n=1 Tax=Aricia agestis TaxID=91739 RepID=UPI001C20B55E|nr:HIV Tat-specific factor 1 homolog [Aricia agestis]XP_041969850.1 HIV Tat-specific factor 1 homolog [Aricia agestis]